MKPDITELTSVKWCHMLSTSRKTKKVCWDMSLYKPHTGWMKQESISNLLRSWTYNCQLKADRNATQWKDIAT